MEHLDADALAVELAECEQTLEAAYVALERDAWQRSDDMLETRLGIAEHG